MACVVYDEPRKRAGHAAVPVEIKIVPEMKSAGQQRNMSAVWHPMEMICVIGSDLDNYPRLTCHWGKAGNPHRQPGMEAYFAQEPWDPLKP